MNISLEPRAEGPVSGDISPTGTEILMKTYNNVYRYNVSEGQTIQSALHGEKDRLFYNVEQQGESVCWDKSGIGFYTVSEGYYQKIWYYQKVIDTSPRKETFPNFANVGLRNNVLPWLSGLPIVIVLIMQI